LSLIISNFFPSLTQVHRCYIQQWTIWSSINQSLVWKFNIWSHRILNSCHPLFAYNSGIQDKEKMECLMGQIEDCNESAKKMARGLIQAWDGISDCQQKMQTNSSTPPEITEDRVVGWPDLVTIIGPQLGTTIGLS
jgi:hypothetical protein